MAKGYNIMLSSCISSTNSKKGCQICFLLVDPLIVYLVQDSPIAVTVCRRCLVFPFQ